MSDNNLKPANNSVNNSDSTSNIPKCFFCNKTSIYCMKCRCNQWTCKKHRNPEKHNCQYDFTKAANDINQNNLTVIESQKISSI